MKYYKLFLNYSDKSISMLHIKVSDYKDLFAFIGYFLKNNSDIYKIDFKQVYDDLSVKDYFTLSKECTLIHIINNNTSNKI